MPWMWMVVRLLPASNHDTMLPSALSASRFGAGVAAGAEPSSGPAATAGGVGAARERRGIAGAGHRLGVVGSFILVLSLASTCGVQARELLSSRSPMIGLRILAAKGGQHRRDRKSTRLNSSHIPLS